MNLLPGKRFGLASFVRDWPTFQVLLLVVVSVQLTSAAYHYQQQQQALATQEQQQQQLPPSPQQQQQLQLQQLQLQQLQQQQQLDNVNQQMFGAVGNQQDSAAAAAVGQQHRNPDREIFRFNAHVLNSTTVKLVWNLLSGSNPDFFNIEYGPIPDGTHLYDVSNLNGTIRNYTFYSLEPNTHYQFKLVGQQGNHIYKPHFVEVRTPSANHVGGKNHQLLERGDIMPFGVKAEAKSNNSIQLSWTEADKSANFRNSNRVNIIRYCINPSSPPLLVSTPSPMMTIQSSNETTASGQQPAAASPNAHQCHYLNVTNAKESRLIVQKLKPATEYAFAVKTAYYAPDNTKKIFISSGFSMDTVAKTHDIEPSPPRNFTIQIAEVPTKEESITGYAGKLELSWLPPESPNGQLKGYVILYTILEPNAPDDQWSRIEVNGANINTWYVASLKPGVSYYFKMRATNQRGQSGDSETRLYVAPAASPPDKMINMPIPANNVLLLIVICMMLILFLLFIVVSKLACRTKRKTRKGSLNNHQNNQNNKPGLVNGSLVDSGATPKLNGFTSTNSTSSTVAARVGTLARRRDNHASNKQDFWISAMDHQPPDAKSNISEKSNSDMNMAMVSIQRDSPQFATTQLAPALPDYRFASSQGQTAADHHLLQQLQQQPQTGHYHPGQFAGALAYDQMDNATASALMTLTKRQQQQMQKYQIQFAATGGPPTSMASNGATTMGQQTGAQAPSPHQQPPPPPPLNIEQQQQQSLYGTHQSMINTRSLRLHRPTLYDPVSGSFVQSADAGPPNYNSHANTHHMHQQQQLMNTPHSMGSQFNSVNSNTLQFHPHQTSTLLSRRSTNTLRSFQTSAGATYGQLGANIGNNNGNLFAPPPPPSSMSGSQQPQQILQSHQAVINQLNNSTYPSLPLKHVSAVRPQIMSNLEDQIEMELAEKEQHHQQQQQQDQQQQHQQQTIKQ